MVCTVLLALPLNEVSKEPSLLNRGNVRVGGAVDGRKVASGENLSIGLQSEDLGGAAKTSARDDKTRIEAAVVVESRHVMTGRSVDFVEVPRDEDRAVRLDGTAERTCAFGPVPELKLRSTYPGGPILAT